jgi:hypothetical protein
VYATVHEMPHSPAGEMDARNDRNNKERDGAKHFHPARRAAVRFVTRAHAAPSPLCHLTADSRERPQQLGWPVSLPTRLRALSR